MFLDGLRRAEEGVCQVFAQVVIQPCQQYLRFLHNE